MKMLKKPKARDLHVSPLFRGWIMKMLKKPKARYLHVSPPFSGLDHEDAEEAESTLFTRLPAFLGA